jgi:hypothetical protein
MSVFYQSFSFFAPKLAFLAWLAVGRVFVRGFFYAARLLYRVVFLNLSIQRGIYAISH